LAGQTALVAVTSGSSGPDIQSTPGRLSAFGSTLRAEVVNQRLAGDSPDRDDPLACAFAHELGTSKPTLSV
jgi:hypothetical protein